MRSIRVRRRDTLRASTRFTVLLISSQSSSRIADRAVPCIPPAVPRRHLAVAPASSLPNRTATPPVPSHDIAASKHTTTAHDSAWLNRSVIHPRALLTQPLCLGHNLPQLRAVSRVPQLPHSSVAVEETYHHCCRRRHFACSEPLVPRPPGREEENRGGGRLVLIDGWCRSAHDGWARITSAGRSGVRVHSARRIEARQGCCSACRGLLMLRAKFIKM